MATRGAANRGGGPATFVGSVRKWELSWGETELPSYGAVSSNPGSAPRRMKLLRWVRTEERSDDGNNAAPRHPNLVPVEDASIPSWKSSTGGASAPPPPPAAAAAAAPATAAAAAAGGATAAAPGAATTDAAPAGAANGVAAPTPAAAASAGAGDAAAPMDAEGGS